ncbi:hypothetical protein [Aeromonas sp. s5]|uniref:hypothetical protein n=1 Tax=Aeromonas sp. s5 TaxID=3138487 RepID=UPI0034A3F0DC
MILKLKDLFQLLSTWRPHRETKKKAPDLTGAFFLLELPAQQVSLDGCDAVKGHDCCGMSPLPSTTLCIVVLDLLFGLENLVWYLMS